MKKKPSLEKHFISLSKDSLIYGLGNAALRILGLVTAPILTRVFVPAQYGVISLVATLVSFLSLFLMIGMDNALPISFYEYKKERRTVMASAFIFVAGYALIVTAILAMFAGKISNLIFHTTAYQMLFYLVFTTVVFSVLIGVAKSIFRIEFRAKTFAFVVVTNAVLTMGLIILFITWLKRGLVGYFEGQLIGTLISFLLAIYLIRKDVFNKPSTRHIKQMVLFGAGMLPASISYFVYDLSDRFFLNHYSNLNELGLYAIAINIAGLITFISGTIGQAWSPLMMNMYFDKRKEFDLFVPRVLVYFLIIFFAIGCAMATFGLEILMVFTTPKYYGATRALAPMILAMVCYASLQVTAMGLTITRKIKYFVWFSVAAAILNTGLNFLLIPKFQMIGAAWATALTYLFLTVGYWTAGKKFLPLKIDLQKILKLVGLSVLLLFVAPLTWKFGFTENLLIKTAEYIVFLSLIYFLGIFERQELIYVKKYLGQIKTRISRRVGINYGPEIDA